jgi:hypothetical protein
VFGFGFVLKRIYKEGRDAFMGMIRQGLLNRRRTPSQDEHVSLVREVKRRLSHGERVWLVGVGDSYRIPVFGVRVFGSGLQVKMNLGFKRVWLTVADSEVLRGVDQVFLRAAKWNEERNDAGTFRN